MYVLIGNFGNDSIALITWMANYLNHHNLNPVSELKRIADDVYVVSVDTGWAAPRWALRVQQAREYIASLGFQYIRLNSPLSFPELVQSKHNFPSQKFHWCAKFLKGLPILDYLDELDPGLSATVVLAKRRSQAKQLAELPEFELESELYGGRKLWHPLYQHDLPTRNQLITQSGFDLLKTRSLECDPCIYNQARDFTAMEPESRGLLERLEGRVGKPMFNNDFLDNLADADLGADERDIYFSGCGSEFACGE